LTISRNSGVDPSFPAPEISSSRPSGSTSKDGSATEYWPKGRGLDRFSVDPDATSTTAILAANDPPL